MTAVVVADASAVLAWIVESQATPAADAFLAGSSESDFVAPYILHWEVRNVLISLRRRQKISDQAYADALMVLDGLEIDMGEPHDQPALLELSKLADLTGLSLFDASYLQLAAQYRCGLATRDAALVDATRRAGIDCFDLRDVPTT